jgi:hypothetical protein
LRGIFEKNGNELSIAVRGKRTMESFVRGEARRLQSPPTTLLSFDIGAVGGGLSVDAAIGLGRVEGNELDGDGDELVLERVQERSDVVLLDLARP